MSLSVPVSNSSASVALRLLTDAATKSSGNPVGSTLNKVSDTLNVTAPKSGGSSSGTKIVLSMEAAERAYGADSVLMQTARGRADQVEISVSTIPSDKEAYKARIFNQLKEQMVGDPEFMAALNSGDVKILTADEVPELNFQPTVSFTTYKNGSSQGSGIFSPKGFNHEQLQKWDTSRGQVVLGDAYAYYDRTPG